ncbi:MAG: phosphotransferase [Chloroflexi bacterium]|nr:phosphotransferase [Chloroflexota bacterium]
MTPTWDAPGQTVSDAELRTALESVLSRYFGTPRTVVSLDRHPSVYRSSFALEELEARLEDGRQLSLMFKDLSPQGLSKTARQVKPAFLYDSLREIETYRMLLAPRELGTATYYGAVADAAAGRYWLFIEKVPGQELYCLGEITTWQEVARWLARMHTCFDSERRKPGWKWPEHLLQYDAAYYRLWLKRAWTILRQNENLKGTSTWDRFVRLAEFYEWVIERLVALPTTVIHGEFYASNVLVGETEAGWRVCPVDWEMAAVGPGLVDLAALTGGAWPAQEREAMALAYYEALPRNGSWRPAPDDFLEMLDYCRLHLAVQWLGWSPEWSPPPEHAHNWLEEALALAERLEL